MMNLRMAVVAVIIVSVMPAGLLRSQSPGSGSGQTRSARPPTGPPYAQSIQYREETPNLTKVVFKNGLTVLVNEFRNSPLVGIVTYVRGGIFAEPRELSGITEFTLRLSLRGTASRGPGIVHKDYRALSGTIAATAQQEHASYRSVAPSTHWKRALEIQSDVLLNPTFDPTTFSSELEEHIRDLKRRRRNANDAALQTLHELGFAAHRIGRSDAVEAEAMRGLTRDRVVQFQKNAFAVNRIILVISGDVITTDVLNEVARLYGKAPISAEKIGASLREEPQKSFRYRTVSADVPRPLISMGFHTVPVDSPDYPALETLQALLGMGEGSAVSQRLRDQKKMISFASAAMEASKDLGYLSLQMETDLSGIDSVEVAAFTEFELMKRRPPEAFEMERARSILEREYWLRLQTVEARAENLARFESRGGWRGLQEYPARLRKVKPEDVQRVAQKYLRVENCALLEYLPATGEPRSIASEVILKTIQDLLEPSVEQELEAREKETLLALDSPEDISGFKPREVRHPMQRASVWRGPELFIKEDHTAPLISMGFFFPGGKLLEKKSNAGITAMMLRSILHGSKKVEQAHLFRQLEMYGGTIRPVVENDYFGFNITILSGNIEPGLDLLLEIIKTPKMDSEDLARDKEAQLLETRRKISSWEVRGHTVLENNLFGAFPYGQDAFGTEESVSKITAEAVREWFQATVDGKKPIVIIVGDTQGTSLAGYFVKNFSGSRYQETKLPEEFAKPLEKNTQTELSSTDPESQIWLAVQAPPDGDEDSYAVIVAGSYLNGVGGRLNDELVERLKLALSVSVRYERWTRGGLLSVHLDTTRANEEKALKALEQELRHFGEAAISYKEYRSALTAAAAQFVLDQETASGQIRWMVRTFLSGKGIEGINSYTTQIQSVSQEDLQDVARRILKPEKSAIVLVHGHSEKPPGAAGSN